MHELGIARDLFDVVLQKAKESGIKKIAKITVRVGEAAGIETDFLRHSLVDHLFAEHDIAKGCDLEIIVDKVKAVCKKCGATFDISSIAKSAGALIPDNAKADGKEFQMKDIGLACPNCKSIELDVLTGRDVYVESFEGE